MPRLRRFKLLADFDWDWPKQIHRPTVDRVFTLDFLAKGENVIFVAPHGLGKTLFAKNLVHQAILAGHSARFLTASELLLDLNGQETARSSGASGVTLNPRCSPSMKSAISATTPTRRTCCFKWSAAATNTDPWS
jgi:DNA replication protein DnaC